MVRDNTEFATFEEVPEVFDRGIEEVMYKGAILSFWGSKLPAIERK